MYIIINTVQSMRMNIKYLEYFDFKDGFCLSLVVIYSIFE